MEVPIFLQELIVAGKMKEDDVPSIIAEHKRSGTALDGVVVDLGFVSERDLLEIKARKLRIPYLALEALTPDPAVVMLIPESFAHENAVIALERTDVTVTVAIADPTHVTTLDQIRRTTRLRVNTVMSGRGEIVKKLSEYRDHFRVSAVEAVLASVQDQALSLSRKMGVSVSESLEHGEQGSAVVKAVNLILLQALVRRASDIHLVPTSRGLQVKYRTDGILNVAQVIAPQLVANLVSRIKVMARMDITERRLPQDGAIHLNLEGREIDVRVATSPCLGGEKVVMRVLDKRAMLLGLENLGFTPENYLRIRRNLRRPNGIILMVGPTGSGKTTSLYAALQLLNSEARNITTIEDPIEYQLEGITQIQVHTDIGLTFASLLRSILRQDPDVIMVGEIRDLETAEIAIRASMTGHLVLATLHTNDAVSAIVRLLDMGIAPFLIASSLRCVVSQRLVRTLCPKCREESELDRGILATLPLWMRTVETSYRGKGCSHCFFTGFRGRTVVSEVLELSDPLRRKVVDRASSHEIAKVAVDEGMRLLIQDGMQKVSEGVTTLEEVLSVCEDPAKGP